jgi:hypothetical protein
LIFGIETANSGTADNPFQRAFGPATLLTSAAQKELQPMLFRFMFRIWAMGGALAAHPSQEEKY